MPALRVVLIGLGGIADAHLRKLRWIDGVDVVGVCDLSPTLAAAVADRFGVPEAGADAARMLGELRPDAVHVLTPPASHPALVSAALGAGAHVLVEKPIADSPERYTEMRAAAEAAGRMLVEDLNYRLQRVTLQALDLIGAGAIGRPVTVDAAMNVGLGSGAYADRDVPHFAHRLPGGALFNFVSHPASIVAAILGPHRSVGVWRARLDPAGASDDELRALVTTRGASAAIAVTSHAQPSTFAVTVRGTEGMIELDVFAQRLHLANRQGRVGRLVDDVRRGTDEVAGALAGAGRTVTGRNDYMEGLGTLVDRFYSAIRTGGPPPLSLADMDATNKLVFDLVDDRNRL